MPRLVDWNADGFVNPGDEWIELYNAGSTAIDLSGWFLDDAGHGSQPYRIPPGTVLGPEALAVFYRKATDIDLYNKGDTVRLLDLNGEVVDSVTFGALPPDASLSRDMTNTWHTDWPPSAGAPNASSSRDTADAYASAPLSRGAPNVRPPHPLKCDPSTSGREVCVE